MKTELYKVIKSIDGDALSEEDKRDLLKIFISTNNSLIRDHIAMLFSDIHYNKAVPFIIRKIKDKRQYNNNGTLVAALRGLNAEKYFSEFIRIMLTQDYEARLWVLDLIEDCVNKVSKRSKVSALKMLTSYKASGEIADDTEYNNSRQHFVEETIKLIKISCEVLKINSGRLGAD
jgi:hypothetical protein